MRYAIVIMLMASLASAAPAPYPLTVDSRAQSIPKLTVYRASQVQFALSFTDGATKSDLTGHTAWMSWSTNASATTVSTGTVSITTATNGTATATFSASAMNYAPGRYIYEIGATTGTTISVYRQGVLEILGSPYATGAGSVPWTTNFPWSLITGTPTSLAGYGITGVVDSISGGLLTLTGTTLGLTSNAVLAAAGSGFATNVSGGLLTFAGGVIGLTTTEVVTASGVASYLPLAGGTMAGTLAMGANNITSTGYVGKASGARIDFLDNMLWGSDGQGLMSITGRDLRDANGLPVFYWSATGMTCADTAAGMGADTLNAIGGLYENSVAISAKYTPLTQVALTNSTTLKDGVLNGTNGVYFTKLGTNYWILLE